MQALTVPAGVDKDWQITANDGDGNPVAFAGTETLAADVWPGDSRAVTFHPAVAFLSPATGVLKLTVAAAQTAALEPGMYRLRASAASGGRTIVVLDGQLQVTPGPGAGLDLSTYASYSDLLLYCPWIESLQDVYSDVEGYQKQRHRARTWLDQVIQAHQPTGAGWAFSQAGFAYTAQWQMPHWAGRDPWLKAELDANTLIVDDLVREIVSKKAAAFVCETQVAGASSAYVAIGARMHAEAEALVHAYQAELDLNGDGQADVVIDCGVHSLRP